MRFWLEAGSDAVRSGLRLRVQHLGSVLRGLRNRRGPRRRRGSSGEMGAVIQDVRFGLRSLRRSPGFTVVSALTLGIGIGATSSIFSIVYSSVLRPLPYADPGGLVAVFRTTQQTNRLSVSYPDFHDWREQNSSFVDLGGYAEASAVFRRERGADEIRGTALSAAVLPLLGRAT